jgi:hypothetical protein
MTSTGMNVDALWRPYATADAANAALNKAAVKLGREKAKLFPL